VQTAYGNEALNRSNVVRRYSRFRDGRELVEDDERGGRQKSTKTEVNIAAVAADLVKSDRRIASRLIAISLKHPQDFSSSDSERGFQPSRFFWHDNLPAHKAAIICQMLQPFVTTPPPLHTRFISVPDYFLFPKLKIKFK
jgi:hypothetical protein